MEVINHGVLDLYCELLSHKKTSVKREVCWSLSNIPVGNPDLAHQILKNKEIVCRIMNLIVFDNPKIVKEATWIFMNISQSANFEDICILVESDILKILINLLDSENVKII